MISRVEQDGIKVGRKVRKGVQWGWEQRCDKRDMEGMKWLKICLGS